MVSTSLLATQTTTLCGRRAFHRATIDAGAGNGVGEANPVLPGGTRVGYALSGRRTC